MGPEEYNQNITIYIKYGILSKNLCIRLKIFIFIPKLDSIVFRFTSQDFFSCVIILISQVRNAQFMEAEDYYHNITIYIKYEVVSKNICIRTENISII